MEEKISLSMIAIKNLFSKKVEKKEDDIKEYYAKKVAFEFLGGIFLLLIPGLVAFELVPPETEIDFMLFPMLNESFRNLVYTSTSVNMLRTIILDISYPLVSCMYFAKGIVSFKDFRKITIIKLDH